MKKLKVMMDGYSNKLNAQWKSLSTEKQHRYTLYIFLLYVLLTVSVIIKIWYDTSQSDNHLGIEHIENPIQKK